MSSENNRLWFIFTFIGAAAVSYAHWHNATLAFFHGLLGPIYIIYSLIRYGLM